MGGCGRGCWVASWVTEFACARFGTVPSALSAAFNCCCKISNLFLPDFIIYPISGVCCDCVPGVTV